MNKLSKKQIRITAALVLLIIVSFIVLWFAFLKKPTCKVVFYPENGNRKTVVKVLKGGTVSKPAAPIKDGYQFNYWSSDGTTEFDFNQPVTENTELTAQYLKVCTVTFIANDTVFETQNVVEGSLVKTPGAVPEVKDMVFEYWELSGEPFDFSAPVEDDITVNAKFADRIACTSVSFESDTYTVGVGENYELPKLNVFPADCTDTPEYMIDDISIAVISESGYVTGLYQGKTILRVKCGDKTAEAELVCAPPVEFITLDSDVYNIRIGESVSVSAKVEPAESSVYKLTYLIEDGNVAYVDDNGKIIGRSGGSTKLTVTAANGILANATINVNSSSLTLTGLPSSFYLSYDSDATNRVPVTLTYTEWRNGVLITDNKCEGALLQCSINEVKYKDGFIYQTGPVSAILSSELYFTYLTSKSNSCFVVCEPALSVKSTENLVSIGQTSYRPITPGNNVTLQMNCSGSWTVVQSGEGMKGFTSDSMACSFTPGTGTTVIRFMSSGGQTADFTIS